MDKSGLRVTRELDRIIAERGKPKMIVSDNGTEFTNNAILRWPRVRRQRTRNDAGAHLLLAGGSSTSKQPAVCRLRALNAAVTHFNRR